MKILQVGSPFTDFEGKLYLTFKSTKGLKELGNEIAIVTTDADCYYFDKERSKKYNQIRKRLNSKKVIFDGIDVYVAHAITPKFGNYCPSAKNLAEKIIKDYDIIHICSWYTHLGMVFAQVAYEYDIPFVISPWGSLQKEARNMKKHLKVFADWKFTKRIISHGYFHTVGDSETKDLIELGVDPDKIFRIDHPVNLNDFVIKNNTDIIKKLDLNSKPYILYLARINRKKGLELLLQSFKKISMVHDVNLVIAGSGEDNYIKEVKQIVTELNIIDRVKFTGLVSEDEKLELLKSATLFTLTSHSDVHPIAVQEALTVGTPVVITEMCDYPEVVEYNAGKIVTEDENAIVSAISEMLKNKELLETMSNNAIKLIDEKFLQSNQIKKHEEMYNDAIKKFRKK